MSRKTGRSDSPIEVSWCPRFAPAEADRPTTSPVPAARGSGGGRHKTRRLEFSTLETLQQEVSMYLDSVAQHADGQSNTATVDAALHEALRVLRTCWVHGGSRLEAFEPVAALSPITTNLLLTFGSHVTEDHSRYVVLRGGPEDLAQVGALLAVLRSIVLFRSRAEALLLRQQQHQRRNSSRAPAAMNGISGDPFSSRHLSGSSASLSSPFQSYNVHTIAGSAPSVTTTQPYTSSLALADESSQDSVGVSANYLQPSRGTTPGATLLPRPVSRLIVLNCHAFGWMDSLGRDDYERSAQALQRVSTGLDALVQEPTYAAVGRPPSTAEGRRRMGRDPVTVVPAATTVLLSDAILMEGGVPSLALYDSSTVIVAHHQYGRGLACLVPARAPPAPPPSWQPVTDSRGYFVAPAPPIPPCDVQLPLLPPTRLASDEESLGPPCGAPASSAPTDEEEEDWMDLRYHRALGTPTPSFPSGRVECGVSSGAATTLYAATDLTTLKPVSCGARTLPGMAAQAVLLAPAGPLLLHVQFDPHTTTTAGTDVAAGAGAALTALDATASTAAVVEEAMLGGCRRVSRPTVSSSSVVHPASWGTTMPISAASYVPRSGGGGGLGSLVTDVPPAQAREVITWMLQLLRCPQPAILVEWHLDGRRRGPGFGASSATPVGATAASSAVLRLLQSCAESLEEEETMAGQQGACSLAADDGVDGRGLVELVHDTAARFTRWPAPPMPQPDGRERPFIFTRGLELAPEGERLISENAVATSLQYRSL